MYIAEYCTLAHTTIVWGNYMCNMGSQLFLETAQPVCYSSLADKGQQDS